MNIGKFKANLSTVEGVAVVAVLIAGAVLVYEVVQGFKKAGSAAGQAAVTAGSSFLNLPSAADSASNLNAGTPYAGTGVVGTLGDMFNGLSGGLFGNFGEWLGGKAYDLTHPAPTGTAATDTSVQGGTPTQGNLSLDFGLTNGNEW